MIYKSVPSIVISGLRGGSGKTVVSLSLIAALKSRNLNVIPFKKGPDYIDAGWLARVAGRPCYNLDMFMMTPEQVLGSFSEHVPNADIAVIEGNRGLYDGMDHEGTYSTAELSKLLQSSVIISIDCTKATTTIAALVLGCMRMDEEVRIKGVVLNRVATGRQEALIKRSIQERCGIPVLGVIPRLKKDPFPERHMGLTPFQEHGQVEESINAIREIGLQYLDMDEIMKISNTADEIPDSKFKTQELKNRDSKFKTQELKNQDSKFKTQELKNQDSKFKTQELKNQDSKFKTQELKNQDSKFKTQELKNQDSKFKTQELKNRDSKFKTQELKNQDSKFKTQELKNRDSKFKTQELKNQHPATQPIKPTNQFNSRLRTQNSKLRIGVIRDSAFQFYYEENFEALSKRGAELIEVSPLTLSEIPDIDALYIGGGFPETHALKLSDNEGFRRSLKDAIDRGLPVYAECGGLMYLGKSIIVDKKVFPMVNVFPVSFGLGRRPKAHGYTVVEVAGRNPFFDEGVILRGHEFHYSSVLTIDKQNVSFVFNVTRGKGIVDNKDGICYKNVLAAYTHLHATGAPEWTAGMIRAASEYRRNKIRNK